MPKSTLTCNSILALIFNATAWADIAQNDDVERLDFLHGRREGSGGDVAGHVGDGVAAAQERVT